MAQCVTEKATYPWNATHETGYRVSPLASGGFQVSVTGYKLPARSEKVNWGTYALKKASETDTAYVGSNARLRIVESGGGMRIEHKAADGDSTPKVTAVVTCSAASSTSTEQPQGAASGNGSPTDSTGSQDDEEKNYQDLAFCISSASACTATQTDPRCEIKKHPNFDRNPAYNARFCVSKATVLKPNTQRCGGWLGGYSFMVNGAEVNVDEERLQRALSALSGGGQGSGALQLLQCGVPEKKLQ